MKSTTLNAGTSTTRPHDSHSNSGISRWIVAFALLSGLFIFPGCASIVSGTKQNVKITSNPDAANVKVEQLSGTNNFVAWQGKTPASVKLSRNESYIVTVSSDGFKSEQIPVSGSGMNGWIWGNIFVGGLFGVIIDSVDGAAKALEPNAIDVKLVSSQAGKDEHAEIVTAPPDDKKKSRAASPKQTSLTN